MNNDGIDVDSSSDAVIENIYYDGGDDGIAIKSGMCQAGSDFAVPTSNVQVTHVTARTRSSCFVTGSEDQGGVHNVSVSDFSCRDSGGGIILKDTTLPFRFGGFPKSNMTFSKVRLHNISCYWNGQLKPGTGLAIQGVRGFAITDVVGTLVPKAGNIEYASSVTLANISITGGHGFSCGRNVSSIPPGYCH